MPGTIQASTAYDHVANEPSIAATCERMIREQIPNLFRLYVNPYVAQACYCLTRLVAEAWPELITADGYQVFLANSGDEALSGAIKLARYSASAAGRPPTGLILDEEGRFDHFAFTELAGYGRLDFIPGLAVTDDPQAAARLLAEHNSPVGFVVAPRESSRFAADSVASRHDAGIAETHPLLIVYTTQNELARPDRTARRAPDIVVFDESFVNGEVPFGAFVATKRLYQHWNRRGMTTFHSTTYQPNTISTLHLVSCLRRAAPEFIARHRPALERIENDPKFRYQVFGDLYSRSLAKVTSVTGAKYGSVRASGHYVSLAGKRIFDGVGGVACSLRGHNPPSYVGEMQETGELSSCRDE